MFSATLSAEAVEIEKRSRNASERAQDISLKNDNVTIGDLIQRAMKNAMKSPKSTFSHSWKELEEAASKAAGSTEFDAHVGIALKEAGIIDHDQLGLLEELKEVGQKAKSVPSFALEPESAANYALASGKLARVIADNAKSAKIDR